MGIEMPTRSKKIDEAVLLAAGLGTRLRPLTEKTPKPLLPLNGKTIIDHQLEYLAKAGMRRVAINIHHLGGMIKDRVGDGARYGLDVVYSEEPEILGTGGGLKQASRLLQGRPIVVLNCDALICADIGELTRFHIAGKSEVTMVLKKIDAVGNFTPVHIDSTGKVCAFGSGDHVFTGLQIVGNRFIEALPPVGTPACLVKDGYRRFLKDGIPISSFIYEGPWNDIGTPERLEQARRDYRSGGFSRG